MEELRNDIYASFLHCSSSDANPQHHLCPKSVDSYCFYQRAIARKENIPSHKTMKVQFVLPSNLRQKVCGEYRRLTQDKLLSACLLGKTQNPNEHLHSRIWRFCSKYKNQNRTILRYAVAQSVLDYNVGYVNGFVGFGQKMTKIQQSRLQLLDKTREDNRKKMKAKREGDSSGDYCAGGF